MRFDNVTALDDVTLEAARGEIVCLLGPSGSGKSTLLRAIAGIERPTSGRIAIDGREVVGPRTFVEPERRNVGMVFQDYALFPHLTIAQNVAFGMRSRSHDVAALMERLELDALAASYPHRLSGGERQRVALARALAPAPRVLLMDEPFSSLDSRLRNDVRLHSVRFVREMGTTTVIVTHDPDEALRVADRIALLDRGRVVQLGTPEDLYRAPLTLFAARFFSDVAPITGTCEAGRLATPLGSFPAQSLTRGAQGIACVRPEHWEIEASPTGVTGRIVASEFCGDGRQMLVEVEGLAEPVALRWREAAGGHAAEVGALLHLTIRAEEVPVVAAT